jgi:hypothetical protein
VGCDDSQQESMQNLHESLNSHIIPNQFDIIPGVGHNVGELYNRVGIEGLQFHADVLIIQIKFTLTHIIYQASSNFVYRLDSGIYGIRP